MKLTTRINALLSIITTFLHEFYFLTICMQQLPWFGTKIYGFWMKLQLLGKEIIMELLWHKMIQNFIFGVWGKRKAMVLLKHSCLNKKWTVRHKKIIFVLSSCKNKLYNTKTNIINKRERHNKRVHAKPLSSKR